MDEPAFAAEEGHDEAARVRQDGARAPAAAAEASATAAGKGAASAKDGSAVAGDLQFKPGLDCIAVDCGR